MLVKLLLGKKMIYLAGGVALAVVGKMALKSDTARDICVRGMAAGMKLKNDAREAFENMKEQAADMYHDASILADSKDCKDCKEDSDCKEDKDDKNSKGKK